MVKFLKNFKVDRKLWYPLVVDVTTFLLIIVVLVSFNSMLVSKAYEITGGKGVEELKIDLLKSADKSEDFTVRLKMVLILWLVILPVLILLSFMAFAYSRKLIWGTKKHWRWNLLLFTVCIFLFFYLIIYLILKMILNLFIVKLTEQNMLIVSSTFNGIFFLLFLIFTFILFKNFAESYKVTSALNKTIQIIKNQRKKVFKLFSIIFVISFILSLLITFIHKKFYWTLIAQPEWLLTVVQLTTTLIFIAWVRIMVIKYLKNI